MNRRNFLTRLASGAIGLSLVDVEWIPTPPALNLSAAAPLTDISTITAEYLRRLVGQLDRPWREFRGVFVPGTYALGDHDLTEQLGIDMMLSVQEMTNGINTEMVLVPAAHRMAHEIDRKGLRAFGALPATFPGVDAAVATDEKTGVTVRCVQFYDIEWDAFKMRFDVLGKAA